MAFPTMQTADVQHGVVTSNSNSWTLTYPTNLVSGDLLIALMACDGGLGSVPADFPTGWTNEFRSDDGGANVTLMQATKVADGTETGTFSVALNASEQGGWRIMRITGWYGTLGTTNNNVSDASGVKNTATGGASTTPNPPSLDPIDWAAEDTLWIAAAAVDTSRTFSAWPSGYTPGNNTWDDVSGGAGGASLSVQYKTANASSDDPGTFTISNSDDWVATTWAIRPAAAASTFAPPVALFERRTPRRRVLQRM